MKTLLASSLVLGLAWFVVINACASLASWAAGSVVLSSRVLSSCARERMGLLLAIRLLPAAASLLFVAVMFLPLHWRLEPIDARESFGCVLGVLALAGGSLVVRAAARAGSVAQTARKLRACWRLARADAGLPAAGIYEVRGLPGVSLAGVLRPRVLVAEAVRSQLSAAELDVAVAHELAHRVRRPRRERTLGRSTVMPGVRCTSRRRSSR
jgi:Zn-dependent protease with chaperone function